MKYNAEFDRWVTKGGLVYRYSKAQDKLILCKLSNNGNGYLIVGVNKPKRKLVSVHKLVYETFKGKIPDGYEIDHKDTNKENNALDNLIICTHKENMSNPLTIKHLYESNKDKNKGKTNSEFGVKFKEHYGVTYYENPKLYSREYMWYKSHKKVCRWEVE